VREGGAGRSKGVFRIYAHRTSAGSTSVLAEAAFAWRQAWELEISQGLALEQPESLVGRLKQHHPRAAAENSAKAGDFEESWLPYNDFHRVALQPRPGQSGALRIWCAAAQRSYRTGLPPSALGPRQGRAPGHPLAAITGLILKQSGANNVFR